MLCLVVVSINAVGSYHAGCLCCVCGFVIMNSRGKDLRKKRSWIATSFDDVDFDRSDVKVGRSSKKSVRAAIVKLSKRQNPQSLWVEKYQPRKKIELAVHKRKIAEVEEWLKGCFYKKNEPSILLLTGPSGVGKSVTVRVLAEELKMEVKEWFTPISNAVPHLDGDSWKDIPRESPILIQFWEFLVRANKYKSLSFINEIENSRRLILIEEFPNIPLQRINEFHSVLRKFSVVSHSPIIFILSDGNKILNAKTLFPQELQNELKITSISFNPIAPTNLLKILTAIASAELSPIPSKRTLESFVEMCSGDLRMAINALQFSYYTGNDINTSKKHATDKISVKQEMDGSKDQVLYLFHAVGKVLHCKRSTDQPSDSSQLPPHLEKMGRTPLISQPESIVNNASISSECLHLFLHQNYLKFMSNIEDIVRASGYLSDTDMLTSEWTGKSSLEECAALVAVRGLMHSNDSPMPSKWNPIYKPYWYTANKLQQERKNFLNSWRNETNFTNINVLTEILPYSSKLPRCPKLKDTISFYKDITTFSSYSSYRAKDDLLAEVEIVDSPITPESSPPRDANQEPLDIVTVEEDDNFSIEEFSD